MREYLWPWYARLTASVASAMMAIAATRWLGWRGSVVFFLGGLCALILDASNEHYDAPKLPARGRDGR